MYQPEKPIAHRRGEVQVIREVGDGRRSDCVTKGVEVK
jgi:hypothetical protein